MYVIWHNNGMINRNCGIVSGYIIDDLFYNHTKIGQGNILRAANDRPYILKEENILYKT